VFAEQESAQCRFGTPIVDGDQVAVPWSAQTRLTDGGTQLRGTLRSGSAEIGIHGRLGFPFEHCSSSDLARPPATVANHQV
jgi:hypothetical protein